jgi:hypothetical protein
MEILASFCWIRGLPRFTRSLGQHMEFSAKRSRHLVDHTTDIESDSLRVGTLFVLVCARHFLSFAGTDSCDVFSRGSPSFTSTLLVASDGVAASKSKK